MGGDAFFGGYYSYRLNGKLAVTKNAFNREEFGLIFGFGFYIKPFKIGNTLRTPLTDFAKSTNANNGYIRKREHYITISYTF